MRKPWTTGAIALLLVMGAGCAAPPSPYPDLARPLDDANDALRRGRAVAAAHAVISTQLALHHLLGAVTQAAAAELGGAKPFLVLGAPDPKATATYALDAAAGTGRIDVLREGRPAMSVSFRFAHEAAPDGFRIAVREATGTVDGFGFLADGMSVRFREASAGWGADVDLRARLTRDQADVRTASARLALPGGPTPVGTVLGTLAIEVPAHDARFEGAIMAAAGAPVTRGGLDVSGRRAFDVRLAGEGAVEITQAPG